ncbi:MAG: hypothetical protein HY222_07320 [Thaumarchaeota archaeon]|nr:hypothetical protein [Nitrososphaerota archaeon]MBI3642184.1 hypothetical protein [Nitrososphaerota archaeon]
MQNNFEKLQEQKSLFACLLITGLVIMAATFFGKDVVKMVTDFTYIPVTGAFVILSTIISLRFRKTGNHGKAWLLFLGTAISWFIAETTWTVYELTYHLNPFPSTADAFYIAGYPLLFLFSTYYLKPFKKLISRKMIISTSLIAVSIMIPNLYMTVDNNSDESRFAMTLGAIYPIADSIVLVPALIGIFLFFRGEVNFLWTLLLIGILLEVIADTGFQYFTLNNSYYTGHPIDILFVWSYIIFSFGVYSHIQIFKKSDKIEEPNKLV